MSAVDDYNEGFADGKQEGYDDGWNACQDEMNSRGMNVEDLELLVRHLRWESSGPHLVENPTRVVEVMGSTPPGLLQIVTVTGQVVFKGLMKVSQARFDRMLYTQKGENDHD